MDPHNLRTASLYINNLLLSRGLLRNGTPIEFATPTKGEGGVDATMAKVMNLVHDLILRRDREADTLSSLSQNIQTLRTSSSQHTQIKTRLETRNADLERQIALTGAQERAARATLRSAETRTRALREEMARLKGTVAQIRGQCANDVRRRDGEIQRLKRHLEGRRGREGNTGQVGVVVVTPGVNKAQYAQQGIRETGHGVDLGSPEYSLKQETTEFLTQLSQGLSDENDALIGLVRGTLATLRSLQGLPTPSASISETSGNADGMEYGNLGAAVLPSYESLAANIDEVLEHLRGLLTNPSFVPLEEVEIREEEIIRLREGWERMEARWREAVSLMDGWRRRMVDTGDTINLDDLSVGLKLDSGLPPADGLFGTSHLNHDDVEEEYGDEELNSTIAIDEISFDSEEPPIPEESGDTSISDLEPSTTTILSPTSANARPPPSSPSPTKLPTNTAPAPQPLSRSNKSQILQHTPSFPQTISQKLARAQTDAEETTQGRTSGKRKSNGVCKVKKGRGGRRRSTLSPEELEKLMGGF